MVALALADGVLTSESNAFYDVTILAEDDAEITLHYVDYQEIEFEEDD